MTRVVFVQPDGTTHELDAEHGQSIMRLAKAHSVQGIIGECNGEMICATCHVFVDGAWLHALPQMSDYEEAMLDVTSEVPTHESRLSCQILLCEGLDGIVVRIPRTQR
jgi:ferredoxin, 2Fe-2S